MLLKCHFCHLNSKFDPSKIFHRHKHFLRGTCVLRAVLYIFFYFGTETTNTIEEFWRFSSYSKCEFNSIWFLFFINILCLLKVCRDFARSYWTQFSKCIFSFAQAVQHRNCSIPSCFLVPVFVIITLEVSRLKFPRKCYY